MKKIFAVRIHKEVDFFIYFFMQPVLTSNIRDIFGVGLDGQNESRERPGANIV